MDSWKTRLNLAYLGHRLREDWPSLLLLGALLCIAAGAVAVAGWVDGLWVLPTIGVVGLMIGYLLAISAFSEITMIVMGVVYGIWTTWYVLATRFLPESLNTRQQMIEVVHRVALWTEQALEGGFSRDNLMFVLSLSVIVWMLGFNAAANMFRSRRLWYAAIPPGLALLINTYYYAGEARMDLFLVAYLFLAFTLAVRTNAITRERLWRSRRVGYMPGTRFDLLRAGMIAGVIVIALAWSAPAASASNRLADAWDRSVNPWHKVQDTFQRLFGGVKGGSAVTADYYGGPTLSMGGPVHLTNATVMYAFAPDSYRYYWRSRVFDHYDDGEWTTNSDARQTSDFGILGTEQRADYAERINVQQKFEIATRATRLVYAAPQPVSFASLPISYDVDFTSPGSKDYSSAKVIRAQNMLEAGKSYSAVSSVSVADQQSLRLAPTAYPDWVKGQYLQLPNSITQRTKDLAAQIAAPYNNPYDQARAIEEYLRQNIKYNADVAPVPAGHEPVDYVLFDSKEGYCTYYAGAMTVMLRSLGIPARVAAGFAQGERDPNLQAYRVAEADAHAWVEAYFPGFGWIEFEPTAAQPQIVRPETPPEAIPGAPGGVPTLNPSGVDDPASRLPKEDLEGKDGAGISLGLWALLLSFKVPPIVWWLLGLIGVVAAAGVGTWFWLEQHGLQGLSEVSRSYGRLNVYAPWLGLDLPDSATPLERADDISTAMPEGEAYVDRITGLYVKEQYAPFKNGNQMELDRDSSIAQDSWKFLRPKMLLAIVRRWLRRINVFDKSHEITIR